jgi:hypothetical protein
MYIKVSANFFAVESGASLSSDAQLLYLKWITFQESFRTFILDDWDWIAEQNLTITNAAGRTQWKRSLDAVTELLQSKLIFVSQSNEGLSEILVLYDPESIKVNPLRIIKGGLK